MNIDGQLYFLTIVVLFHCIFFKGKCSTASKVGQGTADKTTEE
jgi:hypothetical protein